MNILFFGSHQYSLYPLEALYKADYKIIGVFTQPDRPVGRHQTLMPTPVKIWAQNHKIPALTPKDKTELSNQLIIQSTNQLIDLAVLCVYGEIIPLKLLKLPKYGFLNLHPSLLPEYRGASPVQGAIIAGEKETGVTVFLMDEKLDHGPIIAQEKEEIKENDTAEILYHRLLKRGSDLLMKILPKWTEGYQPRKVRPCEAKPQDDSRASYARMLKRNDGFIPWEYIKAAVEGKNLKTRIKVDFIKDNKQHPFYILHSAFCIHNCIRALSPWPGAWTKIRIKNYESRIMEKRLKLLKSRLEDGRLILDEVQLEGEQQTSSVAQIIGKTVNQ